MWLRLVVVFSVGVAVGVVGTIGWMIVGEVRSDYWFCAK